MAILERFDPPAFVNDFQVGEEALRDAFRAEWDRRVHCWFAISQVGDPWDSIHDAPRGRFFNPVGSDIDNLIIPDEPADWTAFPKRLQDYYTNVADPPLSDDRIRERADLGPRPEDIQPVGQPFDPTKWQGPLGPRGWQDEYCEWAVTRNDEGKIIRVTFTCENPEYWETLWAISPEKVTQLYRELLGIDSITIDDLTLRDGDGNPIMDPETARPRYNRTNRFNRNVVQPGDPNGVIHLISRPNNLFAEIFLAGGATILRKNGPFDPITDRDVLIACGQFGAAGRNSDPNIGFYVNDKVLSLNIEAALANPVGLYIASLNTQDITLPDTAPAGFTADQFWQIKRGSEDFILRAEFAAPPPLAALGITVSDLKIEGNDIRWGSQLAERIQVKLHAYGRAVPGGLPPTEPCRADRPSPPPKIRNVFAVLNGQFEQVVSPSLKIERGATHELALIGTSIPPNASVQVSGSGVVCHVQEQFPLQGGGTALLVDAVVSVTAELGLRDIAVGSGGTFAPAAPCLLDVVEESVSPVSPGGAPLGAAARHTLMEKFKEMEADNMPRRE